jgi:hypothetical protein
MLKSGRQILSVKDNGPGIPEEEIPNVLQSFGQGSLAHQTAEGGTGLGLPIVRGLIQMHGGDLDLKSVLRKGTEVSLVFPENRSMLSMPALPLKNTTDKDNLSNAVTGSSVNLVTNDKTSLLDENVCCQYSKDDLRTFIDQRMNLSKHPDRNNASHEGNGRKPSK